jgi:hypothetical protein
MMQNEEQECLTERAKQIPSSNPPPTLCAVGWAAEQDDLLLRAQAPDTSQGKEGV